MTPRTKSIGYRVILFVMFGPLIPSFAASLVAALGGCDLDEGDIHPCVVFGTDIGAFLYEVSMIGLLTMGTFPLGIIALIVFALIAWLTK